MKLINNYVAHSKQNRFVTKLCAGALPISKNLWYRLICVLGIGIIALSPIAGSILLQIIGIGLIGLGSFSLAKSLTKKKQTKQYYITQLQQAELEKLYKKPIRQKEATVKKLGITTPLPQNTINAKAKLLNVTALLKKITNSPEEEIN